jgi:hypothetical protein
VLNQSQGYWFLSNALADAIAFICQFQHDLLGPNFGDTQDFDGELHIFQKNMQGQVVYVLNPFLSIMVFVRLTRVYNMLVMMLNLHYEGLQFIIQYVSKEITLQIGSEYDC